MDTIENSEPVGGEGATSSQDTSEQVDTQPEETAEVVSANETGESGEAPKKLAGKYDSPEDLEHAYKELEGKLGTLGQRAQVADLFEEKYGLTPEQLRQVVEQQELENQRQRYADNPLAPVLDEVASLRQMVQQQEIEKANIAVEQEIDGFLKDNSVYAPFKDQIKNLALTEGIGFDANGERPIEEIANEYFGKAIAQGQNDAYKKIEVKKNTQATGVVSTPNKGITLDDMRNMTAAELEAVLSRPTS